MDTNHYLGWILYLILSVLVFPTLTFSQTPVEPEILQYDGFEKLVIYTPKSRPKGLVLLLSGEKAWEPQTVNLAQEIANLDYLVAGIDSSAYLSQPCQPTSCCGNLVPDLTRLARFIGHHYHLPDHPSILVGYATGAAVVYAALAQAPRATFHAGISLNFCPDFSRLDHLCNMQTLNKTASDDKRHTLWPEKRLATTWFVFQSEPACDKNNAAYFVKQFDNAKLTILPKQHQEIG